METGRRNIQGMKVHCSIISFAFALRQLHVIIDQITNDVTYLSIERVLLRRTTHADLQEERNRVGVVIQIVVRIFS